MEIRDYLRAIRRILWLVIAIPIVAGLLVGGFIELQPSDYQANASAVVPAITANGISQSAASQYTSTFKDVLTSSQVIPSVSQKFNIPQPELVTGLTSSTTTASSNLINVVLIGKKGQNLVGAVREATIETMNAIAAPQKQEALTEVADAATLLAQAQSPDQQLRPYVQQPLAGAPVQRPARPGQSGTGRAADVDHQQRRGQGADSQGDDYKEHSSSVAVRPAAPDLRAPQRFAQRGERRQCSCGHGAGRC